MFSYCIRVKFQIPKDLCDTVSGCKGEIWNSFILLIIDYET